MQGQRCRDLRCRVQGLEFEVWGLWFMAKGFGLWGIESRGSGLGVGDQMSRA
jgi:hypothetical protein